MEVKCANPPLRLGLKYYVPRSILPSIAMKMIVQLSKQILLRHLTIDVLIKYKFIIRDVPGVFLVDIYFTFLYVLIACLVL